MGDPDRFGQIPERANNPFRPDLTDPRGKSALGVNLVLWPYQISALPQMSMEVGQMEEVLIKPCRHQFHHPCPLPHCRHQIAFSAHGGIELDVVPVLVLVLKESGVEKNVRPC